VNYEWIMSSKLLHPCKIVVGLFVDPCCFSCKKKNFNLLA
jgi:hypothetical protein